jgi:predicted MFS family arabinose efflux permease
LAVGGTFMVITMAGLQEARQVAGQQAKAAMASMTSAFALGQIAGPALVALLAGEPQAIVVALTAACVSLIVSAALLASLPHAHQSGAEQ